jgi:hypothetical protein
MAEWKDATSYRQGDRASGRQPNAWRISDGNVSIWVGKGSIYNPGKWTMHCRAVGMDTVSLVLDADQPKEIAQDLALVKAANRAREIAKQIERMGSDK